MKAIDEIKTLYQDGKLLPIYEEFYTLQGEGFNAGLAAYFIRIAGCSIGCPWCDSKGAWRPWPSQLTGIQEIINHALQTPTKALLVTGGEPFNYNLEPLTSLAHKHGIKTFVETTGTEPITGKWDWICVSPKPYKPSRDENLKLANELKIIIYQDQDFQLAEQYAQKVNPGTHLFLQAEWSRKEIMYPKIIDYIRNNPKWRLSVQMHKYLGIP